MTAKDPLDEALENLERALARCREAEVRIESILAAIGDVERAMASKYDDEDDDHRDEHGEDERRGSRGS